MVSLRSETREKWIEYASMLREKKELLITDYTTQLSGFKIRFPEETIDVLKKYCFGTSQGVFAYSLARINGGEYLSILLGSIVDFLGSSIAVYDQIVGNDSYKEKESRYEYLAQFTHLWNLVNFGINELGYKRNVRTSSKLIQALSVCPNILATEEKRETKKSFISLEESLAIVNKISQYGSLLGFIASYPVTNEQTKIQISQLLGENFCAANHIAEDIRDFLVGKDIKNRKFGNYVFGYMSELLDYAEKNNMEKELISVRSEETIERIIKRAIKTEAVYKSISDIKKYFKKCKDYLLQFPSESSEDSKFLFDISDYMNSKIDEIQTSCEKDGNFLKLLRKELKENIIELRIFCFH